MKKRVSLIAVLAIAMVSIFAVCMFSGCDSKAPAVTNVYSKQDYKHEQSDFGTDWVWAYDYNLTVYSNDTYMLSYSTTAHGNVDMQGKGEQLTVYFGNYTTAESELGEGYLVYNLETATRVIYYQHLQLGQYFGGQYIIDTDNTEWTEELQEATECDTLADYLTKTAKSFKVEVVTTACLINSIA